MKTRTERRVAARYRWDRLMVSFWFAPACMALGAVLLAWAVFWLDSQIPNTVLLRSRFVLAGTAMEQRTALLSIAGTVLATAGVVFTLLTLPLSTVAAQYGSRLLRLFVGDRTTQIVLGMFVATFVYCVAGALSIPAAELPPESPQLTATLGLFLMLGTFATLIVLVQHISIMLQAPNIAAAAGAELMDAVCSEITGGVTRGNNANSQVESHSDTVDAGKEEVGYPVRARSTGYIQFIDPEIMLAPAQERNLVIHLLHKPGHYVWAGAMLALAWPATRVDERLEELMLSGFQIGNARTPTQDIEYAVNQLTEMAVRAMSPAINDPFTAMTCLDHLGRGLAEFVRQGVRSANYYDRNGMLRLVLEPVTLGELLGAAFDMLRHASRDNARVLLHMLEVIDVIGEEAATPEARQLLLRHVGLIQAESQASRLIEHDQKQILRTTESLQKSLSETS